MAVLDQSGPRMIALTTLVTYAWPAVTLDGGCSLTRSLGITHETAGSRPVLAARKKLEMDCTLPRWWLFLTVSKNGSGFHIDGVSGRCLTASQESASSCSQSGSFPLKT